MFALSKSTFFLRAACAGAGWPTEPAPRTTKEPGRPLHDTVFSISAISQTAWYMGFSEPIIGQDLGAYQVAVDKVMERRKKGLLAFYDKNYLRDNRCVMREYAAWCDKHNHDYALTNADKLVSFVEHAIEDRRTKDPNISPKTLFNFMRKGLPVLERIAGWQGWDHMASGVWTLNDIKILKK